LRSLPLAAPHARSSFEQTRERVRKWYGLYVSGYVVMPEPVHWLVSEPERGKLSAAIQMLKQNVASQLRTPAGENPHPVSPKSGRDKGGTPSRIVLPGKGGTAPGYTVGVLMRGL
jgi:REP element-mobilizing transposase RayT